MAVAAPCTADDRDRDVGRDSGGDPEADVAGGGADGRAHSGSESNGQAERSGVMKFLLHGYLLKAVVVGRS